ncbi:hypothetical protein C483_11361 [Natrialba hulunbeirensis JCM 10989]|uniref:DUF7130 domain-containing protein n=1 Tax=Natrialba hulunbeirensis JCM 10989 TaxID=1227493 RepID=L9ZVZ7_9EURY|nr:hypothetical protein [Natrialba hulunbeirensis]ELY90655.1 hypothetical protein C483_11361 [Natrialba hulunbeirensis JCM 10989]
MGSRHDDSNLHLGVGTTVYTGDSEPLGNGPGFDVTIRDGMEGLSVEHVRSGHEFGEAHLMWRCLECGEMDDLDEDLPEQCPSCGTERENLYYWTED